MTNFPKKPTDCDHPFSKRFVYAKLIEGRKVEGCTACGSIRGVGDLLWIDREGKRIPKAIKCPDGSRGAILPCDIS